MIKIYFKNHFLENEKYILINSIKSAKHHIECDGKYLFIQIQLNTIFSKSIYISMLQYSTRYI